MVQRICLLYISGLWLLSNMQSGLSSISPFLFPYPSSLKLSGTCCGLGVSSKGPRVKASVLLSSRGRFKSGRAQWKEALSLLGVPLMGVLWPCLLFVSPFPERPCSEFAFSILCSSHDVLGHHRPKTTGPRDHKLRPWARKTQISSLLLIPGPTKEKNQTKTKSTRRSKSTNFISCWDA